MSGVGPVTMYEKAKLHEYGIRRRRQRLQLAKMGKTWDDPDVRRIEEHDQQMQNVQDRLLRKIIEFSNRRSKQEQEQGDEDAGSDKRRRRRRGEEDTRMAMQSIITEEELQEMDPETREDFLRKKKRLEKTLMVYNEEFQQYWRDHVENVHRPRGFILDYWRSLASMAIVAFLFYQIYLHLIILDKNPQIKKVYIQEQKMKRNDREDLWKSIISERRAKETKSSHSHHAADKETS